MTHGPDVHAPAGPTAARAGRRPLLRFERDDSARPTRIEIDPSIVGAVIPDSVFGGFLEHLSFSILGGVSAELLANPAVSADVNLTPEQRARFLGNGSLLEALHDTPADPERFRAGWLATPLPTGFGVAVLDPPSGDGVPFGWTTSTPAAVSPTTGRLGWGVRLSPGSDLAQAVFLPDGADQLIARLWIRLDPKVSHNASGALTVELRRRRSTPIATARHPVVQTGIGRARPWASVELALDIPAGLVAQGEAVDFRVRWEADSRRPVDLVVDRVSLQPATVNDGLDPTVIQAARARGFASLRWPGGNFASVYRWREGVGPVHRRPTVPNEAWGGLEYHLFGTDEYIAFCRAIGAEPHITVNSATAPPEEAAAWVEYCNGPTSTPMGALRASHGHISPYDVRVWEVGNETYADWQAGFHGAEENARRFVAFATAMRSSSPIPLQLIACGNSFDDAWAVGGGDHVTADGSWHEELLERAAHEIDLISLHSIPMNDSFPDRLSDDDAQLAVLAQVSTWDRRWIPALLDRIDRAGRLDGRPSIGLAMTEWGPLGGHPRRLMAENVGAVVYAATFLNMVARWSDRIPMASPNGFMHGGCVRKAGGRIYLDPQVVVQDQYRAFAGSRPLGCAITGPAFDVDVPADIGQSDVDVPFIDALVCRRDDDPALSGALANRHPSKSLDVEITVKGSGWLGPATVRTLAFPDPSARVSPAEPDRFPIRLECIRSHRGVLRITLPPSSAVWIGPWSDDAGTAPAPVLA